MIVGSRCSKRSCASVPTTSEVARTPSYTANVSFFSWSVAGFVPWLQNPGGQPWISPGTFCQRHQVGSFSPAAVQNIFLHLLLPRLTQEPLHELHIPLSQVMDQYCRVGTPACVYMYMDNICCTYKTYLYFTCKTLIWFSLFTSCSNLVGQCLLLSICLYQNVRRETIWNATPSNAVIDRKPGNTKGF